MEKLKTLKDIEFFMPLPDVMEQAENNHKEDKENNCMNYSCPICVIEDTKRRLKQEAIKRVKHFKKIINWEKGEGNDCHKGECLNEYCKCFNEGRVFELEEFYNIEEEDLK